MQMSHHLEYIFFLLVLSFRKISQFINQENLFSRKGAQDK